MNEIPRNLSEKKCSACEGSEKPLSSLEIKNHLKAVADWNVGTDGKTISRTYIMKNFLAAMNFIQQIAAIAESENHHPDIHLVNYRQLRIDLSTHAIGGLSNNDFILAAKINRLTPELKI